MLPLCAVVLLGTFLLTGTVSQVCCVGAQIGVTGAGVTIRDDEEITCYTVPSGGCLSTSTSFQAVSIDECCVVGDGLFFQIPGDGTCHACIVFGFFSGPEITRPEQGEATILNIGFIKGGNEQQLTGIDRRNIARFSISVTGSAMEGPNADFTIQPTSLEIEGPDAREPFELFTFVRVDGVALETAEDFTLTLEGLNNAGRAILDPTVPGHIVIPTIRVVIEDVDNATLQFTDSTYSNLESAEVIQPAVQLLTNIATDLTVRIVPVDITEALTRPLPSAFPTIPTFNPRAPNIATSVADFSAVPVEIIFVAGGATVTTLDIEITNDDINEVEQSFALFMEVVSATNPDRVDLRSGRFAALGRIIDDDPITIGFIQERYTVYEAFNATGELIPIPIIKENNQQSEITFEVISTISLGSGPTAAQPDEDFFANPPVQRQDFNPNEQEINYNFELSDDSPENPNVPEPTETFQVQLSLVDEGLPDINIGGSLFATATVVIIDDDVIAQPVQCFTSPSTAGELRCGSSDASFTAGSIEECCAQFSSGQFYRQTSGDQSCQACIVFGFFSGPEITRPEQAEATILNIGFIKGGNVQQLTGIDGRNIAHFGITVAGSAMEGPNADFTIQPTSLEIEGPDAREPFELFTFVRVDGVALETAEDFTLTLEGLNNAGRAILDPTVPGHIVIPTIRVVIEDVDNATLQFTDSTYSNLESAEVIRPVVQLLTNIATDLTVRIVPVNITEALTRPLPSAFPSIPPFNPSAPNIATSVLDFSTVPVLITIAAGGTTVITLDIRITNDDINEVEQYFALFVEVVSATNPDRVDLRSGRFAALGRIIDDDPINIGFAQERYTVPENFFVSPVGPLFSIPIIKENNQLSELTFDVICTLILQSGPTAAQHFADFLADPPVQRQFFDPDEQEIFHRFEVFDEFIPEPTETFQVQLSLGDEGLSNVNLAASGGSLFATATIAIIDNDDFIIGFEQNVTRITEDQITLEFCVRIINLGDSVELPEGFSVSLAANTIRGTAADPSDYTALQADNDVFLDIIDDDIRRTCIEIQIIDDDVPEGVEFFSIAVVPDPFIDFPENIRLDPNVAFVEILDNDSPRIGFNQTEYTALESDRVATVYVSVLGDLQQRVTVAFSTEIRSSDSATDTDFVSLSRQLVFDQGTTVIPVEITIIDDSFSEVVESFTVRVAQDPDNPTVMVNPDTAVVSIHDALCPDPVEIFNGMVTFTGNSVDDTATYTCDPGFELIGGTTTTCTPVDESSAAFSPAPPVCRRNVSWPRSQFPLLRPTASACAQESWGVETGSCPISTDIGWPFMDHGWRIC